MKPQFCIAEPGEAGDCFRACIASILGVPVVTVPNFNNLVTQKGPVGAALMAEKAREFLNPLGLSLFNTYCNGEWPIEKVLNYFVGYSPGVPVIVHGMPQFATDEGHAVVAMNGKIVHDPSGAGIAGPMVGDDGKWWFLDVIAVSRSWTELVA